MNLYLKQKLFAIGDKYKFTDIDQKVVYLGKKHVLSLTKIHMNDASGKEVYLIKKKLFQILGKYTVLKDNKPVLYVKRRFGVRPKFDVTDSEGNTYNIQGDFLAHDFVLTRNDQFLGSLRKKYFSFGDAYELCVDDAYDPALFCCFALIIDNCIHNENKR